MNVKENLDSHNLCSKRMSLELAKHVNAFNIIECNLHGKNDLDNNFVFRHLNNVKAKIKSGTLF